METEETSSEEQTKSSNDRKRTEKQPLDDRLSDCRFDAKEGSFIKRITLRLNRSRKEKKTKPHLTNGRSI